MKKGWRDLGEVEKLLEEIGQREKESRIKLLLAEIMALWNYFLEVKGSLSIKRMEMLSGTRKQAQNSCLDRRSTGCSDRRCPAPAPFQPPFWALPSPLVEATSSPPLVDMLSSFGPRGNLRGTM